MVKFPFSVLSSYDKLLLSGASLTFVISPANCKGQTPLHLAALKKNNDIFKIVASELGSDPSDSNPADSKGETPLHIAVSTNNLELVNFLAEKVLDRNPADQNGVTPLHLVAKSGNIEIFKSIVFDNCFIDMNSKDNTGSTPVMLANQFGHREIVASLLQGLNSN